MHVHDIAPRDVLVDARRGRRPLDWIWKSEALDCVPYAHRHIVRIAVVRTIAEVSRQPAHLVTVPAVARDQRRRETLDTTHVLGVVIADGKDPQVR